MRSLGRVVGIAGLVLAAGTWPDAAMVRAAEAQKYALLIGVTKYHHARMNATPLKYPEADALAIKDMLSESGYAVDTLLGELATREAVFAALKRVTEQGNADGVVLVGLFGHGVQYGEDAYYCPYDTNVRQVVDSQGNPVRAKSGQVKLEPDPLSMVSLVTILDALSTCGAGNKVILADCCREDPSAARGRAFGSELKVSDLPRGTAALFSCSANEQAFEHDDWGHGAFTFAFLEECRRLMALNSKARANSVSGPVYDRVLEIVADKTNGHSRQTVNPITNGIVDLQLATLSTPRPAPTRQELEASFAGARDLAGCTGDGVWTTGEGANSVLFTYDFQPGGRVEYRSETGQVLEGTWSQQGDAVEVHVGDSEEKGTLNGNQLVLQTETGRDIGTGVATLVIRDSTPILDLTGRTGDGVWKTRNGTKTTLFTYEFHPGGRLGYQSETGEAVEGEWSQNGCVVVVQVGTSLEKGIIKANQLVLRTETAEVGTGLAIVTIRGTEGR
ncbi:MAG: caspase domain-containing protein [Planctomycetaceae bacterium]